MGEKPFCSAKIRLLRVSRVPSRRLTSFGAKGEMG